MITSWGGPNLVLTSAPRARVLDQWPATELSRQVHNE
jgi:hypothetical protein